MLFCIWQDLRLAQWLSLYLPITGRTEVFPDCFLSQYLHCWGGTTSSLAKRQQASICTESQNRCAVECKLIPKNKRKKLNRQINLFHLPRFWCIMGCTNIINLSSLEKHTDFVAPFLIWFFLVNWHLQLTFPFPLTITGIFRLLTFKILEQKEFFTIP